MLVTKRHDFDNELAYIEIWCNTVLKDCFFAEKECLFADGSLKAGAKKYFYSPPSYGDVEKEIKPIKYGIFGGEDFENLYYIDEDGEVIKACISEKKQED